MKSKYGTAVVGPILTVVALAACAHQSEVATTMEMGSPGETLAGDPVLPTWQALVTPTLRESEVMGEVAIRATEGGDTYSAIAIEGGEPGHSYPWHVHMGDCESGGGIVGDAGDYAPITVDAGGEGKATANVALALETDADYHVNVHRASDDLATVVACGEVESQ